MVRDVGRGRLRVVGVCALVLASTLGAFCVGWRSSSETVAPRVVPKVSQPQVSTITRAADTGDHHSGSYGRHQVTPAGIASPAASQVQSQRPVTITFPSGAHMRVLPATTDRTGVLLVPDDIGRAGWWDGSSRIGDPFGSIVVAGHVDSFTQGIGRFAELLDMHPGDEVRLESADLWQMFRVVSAQLEPKTSLTSDTRVFAHGGDERLVLITCGGRYVADLGGYLDNMVVIADPVGTPTARP